MQYYPLTQLANISIEQLADNYMSDKAQLSPAKPEAIGSTAGSQAGHDTNRDGLRGDEDVSDSVQSSQANRLAEVSVKGRISLVGSGPGSVSMLTVGALHEIKTADLILADKLVPETVLALIPEKTETFIARKFPGNAERAQQELLEKGLAGLQQGKKSGTTEAGGPLYLRTWWRRVPVLLSTWVCTTGTPRFELRSHCYCSCQNPSNAARRRRPGAYLHRNWTQGCVA